MRPASHPKSLSRDKDSSTVAQTKSNAKRKYKGAGAKISIYNPRVQPLQLSSAQIKIQNGGDSIQVGWTVNPTLYGDNRTQLFTFLNTSASQCYNTRCPGFIITNTKIPLDAVLEPISQRGGPQYEWGFFIYREDYSGTWWLVMGPDNTKIGFWPQSIFSGLADLGTYVEWGGEVASVQGIPSPEMGTGDFPTGDTKFDAFCRDVVIVNEFNFTTRATTITEPFSDDPNYYKVQDERFTDFGHQVLFGGFGGIIAH
ncbi:hypothetical protein L1049_007308 [Liquidambar formosana]|uniref:Neprosin PEP catalytic domain-containing protein n=1 Tax=Liquidambar formosana TaxID=63359 RepID=A0AAP0RH23_LIQFO